MSFITQAAIILCSCGSIFLFSSPGRFRYGFLVGLVGSPFWKGGSAEVFCSLVKARKQAHKEIGN